MERIFSKQQLVFKLLFSLLLLVFLIFFFQAWQNMLSLVAFILAYLSGIVLLYLDEQYLYRLYTDKLTSGELENIASRNFLFLLMLPFLSIFVVTSSGSILGIALVLAINFYLLIEMWQLRDEFIIFGERYLSMSKIKVTAKLTQQICWFALVYFIFLLLILFS